MNPASPTSTPDARPNPSVPGEGVYPAEGRQTQPYTIPLAGVSRDRLDPRVQEQFVLIERRLAAIEQARSEEPRLPAGVWLPSAALVFSLLAIGLALLALLRPRKVRELVLPEPLRLPKTEHEFRSPDIPSDASPLNGGVEFPPRPRPVVASSREQTLPPAPAAAKRAVIQSGAASPRAATREVGVGASPAKDPTGSTEIVRAALVNAGWQLAPLKFDSDLPAWVRTSESTPQAFAATRTGDPRTLLVPAGASLGPLAQAFRSAGDGPTPRPHLWILEIHALPELEASGSHFHVAAQGVVTTAA